ncbi:FAD-binding oxidoreductase [bacterium]|nr:MAG: FAD-binding oxidoreductase [bacterium]
MNHELTIKSLIDGEVDSSAETKKIYSHDASMFELVPDLVVFPKNSHDVQKLVSYVREQKKADPKLSLTARSGGTCMSGGSINQSIILDMNRHLNKIGAVSSTTANAQPGVFYRDFEKATLKKRFTNA